MRSTTDRPHWSYSALNQFLKCPLQFWFERVLKLPRKKTSEAQVLGSSVHAALAVYHRNLRAGEPTPTHRLQEAFLASWDEESSRFDVLSEERRTHDDNVALGISLIELYLKEEPPSNIVAVESPLLVPIINSAGDYLEKPLLVVPDLVTRQGDDSLSVREIKTSGRAYSESEVAASLQPTCYGHAVHELTGIEPTVEYTVLVKTRTPRLQKVEAVRAIPDYHRLGDLIQAVERSIDAQSFFPVESPLNCSGCHFFRECRSWTGMKIPNSADHVVSNIEEGSLC